MIAEDLGIAIAEPEPSGPMLKSVSPSSRPKINISAGLRTTPPELLELGAPACPIELARINLRRFGIVYAFGFYPLAGLDQSDLSRLGADPELKAAILIERQRRVDPGAALVVWERGVDARANQLSKLMADRLSEGLGAARSISSDRQFRLNPDLCLISTIRTR